MDFGICHHGTNQIHGHGSGPLLLGKVILAVGFEELVIGPHEAPHSVDQIPEDLHAAHAVKILGSRIFVLQRIGQAVSQSVNGGIGILFIGGDGHADKHICSK